jgi:hypothetical protein
VCLDQSANGTYDDFDVMQDGVKIESGHNRQMAIDAGLDLNQACFLSLAG